MDRITARTKNLLHEIIRTGRTDRAYVDAHTVGFDELAARVERCTPKWAAGICDVPAAQGLADGDLVQVTTPRGAIRARLRTTAIRGGVVFVPFPYGYWDTPQDHRPPDGRPGRAANETTVTDWDPLSEQPLFKTSAARMTPVARRDARQGTDTDGTEKAGSGS